MSGKKMGRPTSDPRVHKISVRLTNRSKEILDRYCKQESVNQTIAVERGIDKLEGDLKK